MSAKRFAVIVAATAIAASLACNFARAEQWNLAEDWSYSTNPFGTWALYMGYGALMDSVYEDWWSTCPDGSDTCYSEAQPAWAAGPDCAAGDVPTWMKSLSPPCYWFDLPQGVVGVHGSKRPEIEGPTFVAWTSPVDTTLVIYGGVWRTRDWEERPMDWALYHNDELITGGELQSPDPYHSGNPFDFRDGWGGPSAVVRHVEVADTIRLEIRRVGTKGTMFVGMQLSIIEVNPGTSVPVAPNEPRRVRWSTVKNIHR